MILEPTIQKTTIVATNYNFLNPEVFIQELKKKKVFDKYLLKEDPFEIINPPTDPGTLNQIKMIMPVKLSSLDNGVSIAYIPSPDFKLHIIKDNFMPDKDFDILKQLSGELIDLKISDISAIGVNFHTEFNLKNVKLQLLNKDVEKIEDFDKNLTFEFVLPIQYIDQGLIATYKIRKIRGGDNTGKDRYYGVDVNFHFDLSELSTIQKVNKIQEVLDEKYYFMFIDKAKKFLELNDQAK